MSPSEPPETTPPATFVDQLQLVDEMVARRPLSFARQLGLGWVVAQRSVATIGWRLGRSLFNLPVWLLLVGFASVTTAALRAPAPARLALLETLGSLEIEIPREVLVSPWLVLSVLALLALSVAGRALLDALLYGGLRVAASGVPRTPGDRVRAGLLGFGALALLEFGLVTAGIMFSWPIVRTIARVLHDPETTANGRFFVGIGLGLTFALVGWMRFLGMMQCAWAAWRARFLAATLVMSTLAPMREPLAWGRLYLLWLALQGATIVGLAGAVEPRLELVAVEASLVPLAGVGRIVLAGFFVSVLIDAALDAILVGMVGWRLGDIPPERMGRPMIRRTPPAERSSDDPGFEPPVEGVFHVPHGSAFDTQPSIVPFRDLLKVPPECGRALPVEAAIDGWMGGGAEPGSAFDPAPPPEAAVVDELALVREEARPAPAPASGEAGAEAAAASERYAAPRWSSSPATSSADADLGLPDWLDEIIAEDTNEERPRGSEGVDDGRGGEGQSR